MRKKQTIYVGCESKGFFKSTDGGATWRKMGLEGERVTAVRVWAWERYYPAVARDKSHIGVTTCADRWMAFLGRGRPRSATPAEASRGYCSRDDIETLTVANERRDTGFYNVIFDKASQSTGGMRYATTHGIQAQIGKSRTMVLFPEQKHLEWLRPFTALAATAMGEQKFGRVIAQALDPAVPGRLSRSERWAFHWSWQAIRGDVPPRGPIAACGDRRKGDVWWFVFTDGLYASSDGGTTLERVLDSDGTPIRQR